LPSHGKGRRFEPCTAHQSIQTFEKSGLLPGFFVVWPPVRDLLARAVRDPSTKPPMIAGKSLA
jgi:hypothetical protein